MHKKLAFAAQRRRWLVHAVALSAVACLPGCSKPIPLLRVGSIVFPGYELMFLARELQLLDPNQVRLVELQSNSDTLRALASGQLEAAAMTLDELMSARAEGVDLRAILVFDVSHGADVVLGRPGTTLQSLRGKRIGVEEGAMGAIMLSALLSATQLSVSDITKVASTLDRSVDIYQRGKVDAVVTAEPWAAQLEKQGALRLFDSAAIPDRIVDVLAVRADALDLHAAALERLVAGYFLARTYWLDHPAEAAQKMATRLQTPAADVASLFRGLKLPDLQTNRAMLAPEGALLRSSLELQRVMYESGLLKKLSQARELADARFLPQ